MVVAHKDSDTVPVDLAVVVAHMGQIAAVVAHRQWVTVRRDQAVAVRQYRASAETVPAVADNLAVLAGIAVGIVADTAAVDIVPPPAVGRDRDTAVVVAHLLMRPQMVLA